MQLTFWTCAAVGAGLGLCPAWFGYANVMIFLIGGNAKFNILTYP